jgi:hypothetical protein
VNDNQDTQNITPMTPDELEANGFPRDFHETRQPIIAPRRAGKSRKPWIVPGALLLLGIVLGAASAASVRPAPVTIEKTVEKRVEVPVNVTPSNRFQPPGCA